MGPVTDLSQCLWSTGLTGESTQCACFDGGRNTRSKPTQSTPTLHRKVLPQWDEPNTTKPKPHRCHVISWIDVLIISHNPASRGRICQVMSSTWQEKSVDVGRWVVLCPVWKKSSLNCFNYVNNSCNVLMNLTYITVFNTHLNPNQVVLLPKPH